MIKKRILFHNMEHSNPLEAHANQKLEKIETLLREDEIPTPIFLEVFLKANKQHPHHRVEINLKTPYFELHAHDECNEMYVALDNSIDKIVKQYNKQRKKNKDKRQKPETAKKDFTSDQYTLGEED